MAGLARYLLIRALLIIPTVLILYTLVFVIMRVIPGDPVQAALGTRYIPPEQLELLRERHGLNDPLYVQYFKYLAGVVRFDFGESLVIEGRRIADDIKERFPATLELTIASFIVSVGIGLATGILAAVKRGSKLDTTMRVYSIVAYTLFIPWLGSMLIMVFSLWLGLLPTHGRLDPRISLDHKTGLYVLDSILAQNWVALKDALAHLILPSLTLGIVLSGAYTRLVRANLSDALVSDFVRAYRARGVSERRILLHALRNSLIPVVTMMGLQMAILLGGAVLTETTFSWPGMGSYLLEKVEARDYTAVQGVVVFFSFMVGLISLVVDAIYALIDPRIRY
ncbi:MAG: ABC transporter permease [Desulfurococcales archaeon]|nr:ABC transporter permease [Desulfurococcales archaeon]MCE4605091.1 ABC transporter permease [Desulfurococcales archaeon]